MDLQLQDETQTTACPLRRLYLIRGLAAVGWAIGFMAVAGSLTTVSATLLVIYPLIDLLATWIDLRRPHSTSERRVLGANAVAGTLATIAVLIATFVGSAAVLAVFGIWATLSGVAQVVVALRRRGPRTGGQWPMLIAGGLSTLVGIFYNITAATSAAPTFDPLVTYAAAGGAFFVVQAGLLTWHERRAAAPDRHPSHPVAEDPPKSRTDPHDLSVLGSTGEPGSDPRPAQS